MTSGILAYLGHVALPTMNWFPQQYAAEFYAVKGVLALVATVLLIIHMILTWHIVWTWSQRLRYLTLLYFAVLITYASVDQIHDKELVDWPNIGGLLGMLLLIVTMVVSIRHDLCLRRAKHVG